ncbi:hypothetical protein ACFLYS_00490 [Chloroflexota bacterium]
MDAAPELRIKLATIKTITNTAIPIPIILPMFSILDYSDKSVCDICRSTKKRQRVDSKQWPRTYEFQIRILDEFYETAANALNHSHYEDTSGNKSTQDTKLYQTVVKKTFARLCYCPRYYAY